MFQHFGNRLKRDLKQLVDRRLDASVVASGSLQKVRDDFPVYGITISNKTVFAVFRYGSGRHLPQTSKVRCFRENPSHFFNTRFPDTLCGLAGHCWHLL